MSTKGFSIRAFRLILIPTLCAAMVQIAFADSMRCGRKVVRNGDSPSRLLLYCGEPSYKGRGVAEVRTQEGRKSVKVEQWHYNPGKGSLKRVVLVYQGEIVGVKTAGR